MTTDPLEVTCPACRNPREKVKRGTPWYPFCSRECRERDLGAWASESYRIPGEPLRHKHAAERVD